MTDHSVKAVGSRKRKQGVDFESKSPLSEPLAETFVKDSDISFMQANQAPVVNLQENNYENSVNSHLAPSRKRKHSVSSHVDANEPPEKKPVIQRANSPVQLGPMTSASSQKTPLTNTERKRQMPPTNQGRPQTPSTILSKNVESYNIPGYGQKVFPPSISHSPNLQDQENSKTVLKPDSSKPMNPKSYDGFSFGRSESSNNVNMSSKSQWVLEQQEKYLKYHMNLFRQRGSGQKYHEYNLQSLNV